MAPTKLRGTGKRVPSRRHTTSDAVSTALLLPGLHPWLKEYFAEENLIPVTDEISGQLPIWEDIPHPTTSIAATRILTDEEPRAVRAAATRARIAAAKERDALSAIAPPSLPAPAIPIAALPPVRAHVAAPPSRMPDRAPPRGARRSTAPVPFVIPIDVRGETPASSQHLLELKRRSAPPAPAAPNFLNEVRKGTASLHGHTKTLITETSLRVQHVLQTHPADGPAPWFALPAPWSELLIVAITVTPAEILWKSMGWPLWKAAHLPHPRAFAQACQSTFAKGSAAWQPRMWRMPSPVTVLEGARRRASLLHVGAFALALLVALVPLKLLGWGTHLPATIHGRVLGASASILEDFRDGRSAAAQSSFTQAIAAFDRAAATLDALPQSAGTLPRVAYAVGRYVPGLRGPLGRAEDARQAGIALAGASRAATRGVALLAALNPHDAHASALLGSARASFATSRSLATRAAERIARVAPSFSDPVRQGIGTLERAEALLPVVGALAGIDAPRRILLLFQNPAELRPTGGFIGSIALLDVADGAVTSLEIPGGGSYDVSGLSRVRVLPPEPLLLLNETWQFHDANWFPDFPTSAAKLRWFYEESGGPTVDAIVAINASFLEDVLALTGPMTVAGTTVTAADVLTTLTDTIESPKARASGAPKAIIGELAPAILERILALTANGDTAARLALTDRLLRALDERDVLLAFTDDAIQRDVAKARWDGALRPTSSDALAVYHTNIGGGKSDAAMRDTITHEATLTADGRLLDRVTITRTHTARPAPVGAPIAARLAAMQNVDYVRLYVPRGATMLTAQGFELPPAEAFATRTSDALPDRLLLATELNEHIIAEHAVRTTEEFGRTVFGGWMLTPAGETSTITITYELPWTYARTALRGLRANAPADPQPYTLTIQKQPGAHTAFTHRITLDPSWEATWTSSNLMRSAQTFTMNDDGRTDTLSGLMIAPR